MKSVTRDRPGMRFHPLHYLEALRGQGPDWLLDLFDLFMHLLQSFT